MTEAALQPIAENLWWVIPNRLAGVHQLTLYGSLRDRTYSHLPIRSASKMARWRTRLTRVENVTEYVG